MAGTSELSSDGRERRRDSAPRHLLRLTGTLVSLESASGGMPGEAVIRNISPTGVLLETEHPVAMGQTIHIELGAAGRQEAQVRWVDGKLLGCQFPQPLAKSRVSAALLQGDHHPQGQASAAESDSPPLARSSQRRDFGLAIAWARKTKGVTQAELAQAIGVSTTSICKWEKGHAQPRAGALARLQDYLQLAGTSAGKVSLARASSPDAPEQGIPLIISEYRARLAEHLGVEVEAIEIQITIKDVMDRKRVGARR